MNNYRSSTIAYRKAIFLPVPDNILGALMSCTFILRMYPPPPPHASSMYNLKLVSVALLLYVCQSIYIDIWCGVD